MNISTDSSSPEASPRTQDYRQEIGELIKNICLAVLNWELKQSDDNMLGIKKHQEEYILIKSQEVRFYRVWYRHSSFLVLIQGGN